LGGYSYMNGLARSPIEKLAGLVTYAASALLGNMHGDPERIARATLRLARLTMLLMTPVFVGVALVAEPLVRGLLGDKWLPFVPALQVLSVYAASYPLTSAFDQAAIALGHTRISALNGLILLVTLPASFFLLGREYGATGLALAWLVPLPLTFGRLVLTIRRMAGLSIGLLIRELWVPVAASLVMAAAVLLLRSPVRSMTEQPLVELALLAASGASTYALLCLWLARGDLIWLRERIRER
jgi:O-antigen/teichoic acid export membrane protein